MSQRPKILCVTDLDRDSEADQLREGCEIVRVPTSLQALAQLARDDFDGLYVAQNHLAEAFQLGRLLQNERILDGMPDGVALVDVDNSILWTNTRFNEWCGAEDVTGLSFYPAMGNPEILGPDFCPFHTALATGQASSSTLRSGDRYFQTHAAPIAGTEGESRHLIVTVRDVTAEMLQQQKLAAIHKAGIELGDLTPDEVFNMGVDERIELLKSNILHYTQDLLSFDVVEIRVLDEKASQLEPLLSYGIDDAAANRPLYAEPSDNGVTGFVAATGKSYLCEDTVEDPLYLTGFQGAKSSLTVPLILHDQVIGTFNVESPEPRAFGESDLQFLEIFSRDVAVALNTLELMAAQSASTAQESCEAIHGAVAMPVDEILNDAVNVMERYIGHEPEVVERLQRILKNARDIKQVIHNVGQTMAPAEAVPASPDLKKHSKLRGCRVLVVDADDSVRNDAHGLLERYGCEVETAHEGGEAVFMVRNSGPNVDYDVIIADIRLPDLSGYELLTRLKDVLDPVPLVLMTGFGYDPGHSIVKARQAGLHAKAILYKPFRLDQLLETVEAMLEVYGRVPQS
ncbi:MAG: two-component system response regulator [Planctomycetaceae bacterium]|nr:two-component system response regulator [Planctomycetaceae bacterium]